MQGVERKLQELETRRLSVSGPREVYLKKNGCPRQAPGEEPPNCLVAVADSSAVEAPRVVVIIGR